MALRAVAAAILISSGGTVSAQGDPRQTPENAKQFIERTLLGSSFSQPWPDVTYHYTITSVTPNPTSVCLVTVTTIGEGNSVSNAPVDWDFRGIRGMRQEGTNVVMSNPGLQTIIRAGTEDMAARLAYAMEFLRQHCDPNADTGF